MKTFTPLRLLFALLVLTFFSGQEVFAQSATTDAATSVGSTTATLNGTVSGGSNNWSDVSFRYATATQYSNNSNSLDGIGTLTQADGFSSPGADGSYSLGLSGLTEGETYYFRIEAIDGSWVTHSGSALSFTTTNPGIDVTTDAATSIGANGATLNATFDAGTSTSGGISQQTFEWGETTSYGNSYTFSGGNAIGDCPFSKNYTISGLSPGTTYHFRAYGYSTEYGTYDYGSDLTFTTIDYATVTSLTAQNITATSADTRGSVTDDGGGTVSERGVVYNTTGTTPTIGEAGNTKAQAASGGTGGFTVSLSSLSSSTTYYYRAYAINEAGTSYGGLQTFDTEAATPEMSIEDSDGTNIADGDATPSTEESTDFGSSSTAVSKTYTIKNTGDATLNLTNSPIVYIGGTNADKFTVTTQPASSTVATSGSVTFTVQFDPANETGTFTAEIIIENDDTDENPFNFNIKGVGLKPEINLKGNGNNIPDDDALSNTPTTSNHTDFTTVFIGNSLTRTFTIENLGNSTLTLDDASPYVSIAGTNAGDFSVTAIPSNSIAATNSTTFEVTFTPSATGTRSAYISIANNDADEDPYTFNIEGTGAVSSSSDIIVNSSFTYPSNIAYTDYDNIADITNSNALKVAEFIIQDGGGVVDDDNLATILSSITFSVNNYSNIDRLALYDGTTELSETGTVGSSVTFSSLASNPSASDGGTKTISVYATFNTTVTDNQQVKFTVSAASVASSSSDFAASDAGGAVSSVDGDDNRIEVTATTLSFNTLSNANVGVALSPQPEVTAVDANGNKDLDFNSVITLSATGGQSVSGNTATASSGVALYTSFTVEEAATTTITASGGSISGTSNSITISASGNSTIISAGNETTNIDYASYTTSNITSTSDGVRVWSFTIQDGGGSADDDNSPTEISALKITQGASNNIADWGAQINKAAIFDGSTKLAEVSVTDAGFINFSSFSTNLIAADDGNKTYDLYLSFETSQTDNSYFQFQIDISADATLTTASSQFSGTASDPASATGSAQNQIEVSATKLVFSTQPSATGSAGTALAQQPQVSAYDANDNTDLDFSATVTLSNDQSLPMSNNTATASSGVASFSGFSINSPGTDIVLTAAATGLTSGTSSTVTISAASSSSWSGTGNWTDPANWSNGVPGSGTDVTVASGELTVNDDVPCNNLTVNPEAKLTIGAGYTLTVNGNLILQSASGQQTGSLLQNGSLSISGSVEVQQYIEGGQWHQMASPLSGLTANEMTPHASGTYVRAWNETDGIWNNFTAATDAFESVKGYSIWYANNQTISFTGSNLHNGTLGIPLARVSTGNKYGWNLVGNPYPSSIDWGTDNAPVTGWTKTNATSTIYFWDGAQYATYSGSANSGNGAGTNGASRIIPPLQGFFVQCKDGTQTDVSGQLTMTNDVRLHGSQDFFKNQDQPPMYHALKIKASGNGFSDETFVFFEDQATNGRDEKKDSPKLFTSKKQVPQVYTIISDQSTPSGENEMVFNTMGTQDDNYTIPLGFKVGQSGNYTFTAEFVDSFEEGIGLELEDTQTKQFINLRTQDTYSFAADSADLRNRFYLHISALLTDVEDIQPQTEIDVYSNGRSVYVRTNNAAALAEAQIFVYDLLGKQVLAKKLTDTELNKVQINSTPGTYIVKVVSPQQTQTKKVFISE